MIQWTYSDDTVNIAYAASNYIGRDKKESGTRKWLYRVSYSSQGELEI